MIKTVKSLPNAILFDWDNTLVNNWDPIFFSYNETLKQLGLKKQSNKETLKNAKYSLRETFPKIFKKDWKIAKEIFYKSFKKIHLKKIKPFPGVENLLKKINKKKIPCGVISNKDGVLLRKEINKLGWKKYFDVLVGANEAKKDKPSKFDCFSFIEIVDCNSPISNERSSKTISGSNFVSFGIASAGLTAVSNTISSDDNLRW